MNESQINYLNIALMAISAVLATFYPFELFLFSFIFMAPLHYLTEISWLEKKQFFIKSKSQIIILILGIAFVLSHHVFTNPFMVDVVNTSMFVLLMVAISLHLFTDWKVHLGLAILATGVVLGLKWHKTEAYLVIITVFLPTIVHITLFTFVFILSGVRKNGSLSGILSLVFFVVCSFSYFKLPLYSMATSVNPLAKELYFEFIVLNKKISDFFGYGQINNLNEIYHSQTGISIMQYIAFSYTYHFLNWFSKTSIIKWHLVDSKVMMALIGIYFSILILLAFNFNGGLIILSILGLAHMYLEIPLNFLSFKNIFKTT